MSTASNLIKSSATRTLFAIVSAAVAFFMMPFLVHSLGERWYGVWVLIGSLAGNYYLLDFGLAAAVTRFVSKHIASNDSEGANVVVNTSLFIYSLLSMVILVVTVTFSALAHRFVPINSDLGVVRLVIVIMGLQFAAEFPFKAFVGILGSYVRYDLLIYSRLINLAISSTLIVFFVSRGHGIAALAVISLFCEMISNAIYFLVARHLFPDLEIRLRHVRRTMAKEMFGYSSWAFASQIANQVRFKIDSVVIASVISATAVTYYAVGLRLVEYFTDLLFRATNLMTPVFTRYWVQGRHEEIREKLLLLTRINAILGVFGGGVILIVGKAFILRWMGDEFAVSYPVLAVLMTAMVADFIGCPADNIFYAMAKHPYLAVINIIEGVLNLALSLSLARPLGIVGVAMGTALPLVFFRLTVIPYYITKFVGLPLRKYYWNLFPTIAFTLVYLGGYFLLTREILAVPSYRTVVAVGVLALPLYGLAIPFVSFSKEERRYFRSLLSSGFGSRNRRP